ncbi:hypothetical protein PENTCL1PPCAC_7686, partial [Pristionchus entomophagus]
IDSRRESIPFLAYEMSIPVERKALKRMPGRTVEDETIDLERRILEVLDVSEHFITVLCTCSVFIFASPFCQILRPVKTEFMIAGDYQFVGMRQPALSISSSNSAISSTDPNFVKSPV